jgi:hypothetical protein
VTGQYIEIEFLLRAFTFLDDEMPDKNGFETIFPALRNAGAVLRASHSRDAAPKSGI